MVMAAAACEGEERNVPFAVAVSRQRRAAPHSSCESEAEVMPSDMTQNAWRAAAAALIPLKKPHESMHFLLAGTRDEGRGEEGEWSHLSLWQNSH